jgi:hypothetical protein
MLMLRELIQVKKKHENSTLAYKGDTSSASITKRTGSGIQQWVAN